MSMSFSEFFFSVLMVYRNMFCTAELVIPDNRIVEILAKEYLSLRPDATQDLGYGN